MTKELILNAFQLVKWFCVCPLWHVTVNGWCGLMFIVYYNKIKYQLAL